MALKEVIQFWWRATIRAFSDLRIKERVLDGLTLIGITLIISWIFTQGITSIDWVKTIWISFSGSPPDEWQKLLVTIVVALLINFIIQPAKMYKELGGFVDNPFKLSPRLPVSDNRPEGQSRSGSITVENSHPKLSITDCFLTLDSILDKDRKERLYSQQRYISWSSGLRKDPKVAGRIHNEIEIRPEIQFVADLVETQNNVIVPTVWSGHPPLEIGKYEFHVNAHGRFNGLEVTKKEVFIVEYVGKNNVSVIKKKTN